MGSQRQGTRARGAVAQPWPRAIRPVAAALLVATACGSPPADAGMPDAAPVDAALVDRSLGGAQAIFTERCAPMCHSGDMPTANLSLEPGEARANLIDVRTVSYCGDGGIRVVPSDPEASCLWQLVRDDVMPLEMPPLPPPPPLTTEEKRVIHAWIASGAPE